MKERFLRLGVKPRDMKYAEGYEMVFRRLGYSREEIDAVIKWGAAWNGTPDELRSSFETLCQRNGIDREMANFSEGWLDQVHERGIENMPQFDEPVQSPQEDARRLAEIQQITRDDPDRYDRDFDLRDEQLAILERQHSQKPKANAEVPTSAAAPAGAAARLQQISEYRRNDPDGYDGNKAMQREELALISAQQAVLTPQPQTSMETTSE